MRGRPSRGDGRERADAWSIRPFDAGGAGWRGAGRWQLSAQPDDRLPALSMPAGFTPEGCRWGSSSSAGPFHDADPLSLARVERATRAKHALDETLSFSWDC